MYAVLLEVCDLSALMLLVGWREWHLGYKYLLQQSIEVASYDQAQPGFTPDK